MRKSGSINFVIYVLSHFLVIVVVITILGGYLYSFFYETAYTDFLLVNNRYISAIEERHENDLQIVDDIVVQIGLANDATRFYLKKQPDKARKLITYLNRYVLVSQFFTMMMYQFHEDEFMYSQKSSIRTDVFLERDCILEETSPDAFRAQIMKDSFGMRILPEQKVSGRFMEAYLVGEERASFYLQTIPDYKDETLIFMVPGSYYDELLSMDNMEMRRDFLYYDGQIIVSRGSEAVSKEELCSVIKNCELDNCLPNKELVQKKIEVNESLYLLTVCMGESGIYYGSLQNMDIFYQKFQSEQWVILFLVVVCAVAAIFITGFSSSRMMRKVRKLSCILDETPTYDLGYIERGIQTLVVTKRASEEENQTFRKARFVRNFFRGYQGNRKDVLEQARKVGLQIDYRFYIVVLLRSKELDNEERVYSLMLEMIDRESCVQGYGIHLVNNNQNLFVLYGDKTEEIEQVLTKLLEIEKQYCRDYVISISDYHEDFGESSKAYLEADTAFDYRYLVNNSEIIRFSAIVKEDYKKLPMENYFQDLKYALSAGSQELVGRAVCAICEKLESENVSLYVFRMIYNDVLQVLISECKGDKSWLDKYYNAFTVSQCTTITEFYELLTEACMVIVESQSGKQFQNSDIICAAVEYMQQNYQNPNLTMNALAEHLKISSVTLSVDFKNEMEVKPSEYLVNLRIEKAKDLLKNTNMLVKEISIAIGYEDDGSFTRRFKRHTGMTPGQYREKCR